MVVAGEKKTTMSASITLRMNNRPLLESNDHLLLRLDGRLPLGMDNHLADDQLPPLIIFSLPLQSSPSEPSFSTFNILTTFYFPFGSVHFLFSTWAVVVASDGTKLIDARASSTLVAIAINSSLIISLRICSEGTCSKAKVGARAGGVEVEARVYFGVD